MCDKILTRRVLVCQSNFTVILSRGTVDLSYKTCHLLMYRIRMDITNKLFTEGLKKKVILVPRK